MVWRFWSFVKQLRQDDPGVADLEIEGKIFSDGQYKAEILNEQFSSVFTNGTDSDPLSVGNEPIPGISPVKMVVP